MRRVFRSPTTPSSTARSFLRELTGSVLSVAFPSACSLCGQELTEISLTGICAPCWEALEPWQGPACSGCGLPFGSGHPMDAGEPRCGECRAGKFAFDQARSFGLYRGYLRAVILQLKFHGRQRLGMRLGALLASVWDSLMDSPEAGEASVVPVPLHRERQRERGFNQAELLASGLARALAKSRPARAPRVDRDAIRKIRATPPQTGLSIAQRHENVRGVFSVDAPERVRGRIIVLVDDVMTTGATLSACASALGRAGARRVRALTLARATPQFPDVDAGLGPSAVDDFGPARP